MAHIVSYTHTTLGTIPKDVWDEAWFTIASWKGYLQLFPGFLAAHSGGYARDNGDVRFYVSTTWEYPEQLEEWQASQWSADSLLTSFSQPAYDLTHETFEDFS